MPTLRQEITALLRLAWPMMVTQLLQFSTVLVDNMIVGHLGAEALAAMALAVTLVFFVLIFGIGIVSAMVPMVGHAFGAGRPQEALHVLQQSLLFCWILAGAIMLVLKQGTWVLGWFGQEAALLPLAQDYLDVFLWSMPAQLGYICLRQFTDATSNTRPAMIIALVASLVNAPLDYALVFGKWGLPRMELAGAAAATTFVTWGMFIGMLIYLRYARRYAALQIRLRTLLLPPLRELDAGLLRTLLKIGLPAGGMWLAEVSFFQGCTLMMGRFGTVALAGHQVALNAISFSFMIPLGLSLAIAVQVAQALGAGDAQRAARLAKLGLGTAAGIQIFTAIVLVCLPTQIASLYTDDTRVIAAAVPLLLVASIFQVFDGMQVTGAAILRGYKDTRVPFIATLVSYWLVGLGSAWWLAFHTPLGPRGLWFSMIIGLGLAAVLHYWRIRKWARKAA